MDERTAAERRSLHATEPKSAKRLTTSIAPQREVLGFSQLV